MTDLFTPRNPAEEIYAERMLKLTQQEEEFRMTHGIIAPWVEADYILAKDELRLLKLIEDAGGYVMRDDDWHVTPYADGGARRVSGFTVAMGMAAEANSKAVLNSAVERGLVTVRRDNQAGGNRVDMTRKARYYLDLIDTDTYWE